MCTIVSESVFTTQHPFNTLTKDLMIKKKEDKNSQQCKWLGMEGWGKKRWWKWECY